MIEKAAHEYLDLGFSVMPVGADKRPMVEWKRYQDVRPSHSQITHWWDKYPHANVGIITGVVSGILVFDLDSMESRDYVKSRGVPTTPMARTSKGIHIYLDYPSVLVGNRSDPKIGMDVRGEGGYVVAPPSTHESGKRYEWTNLHPWNTAIAPLNQWMIDYCTEPMDNGQPRQKGWQYEVLQGVEDGGRNHAAASLAGRFFNKDLSVVEITEILLMWNERNHPPLPEDEIVRTVASIGARHERRK